MIIGVDFDGVIVDSEKLLIAESELYVQKNLPAVKLLDKFADKLEKRYDWQFEEGLKFYTGYIGKTTKKAPFLEGLQTVLEKLRADGHKLYVVTARGQQNGRFQDLESLYEKLEKLNFKFDKLVVGGTNKVAECTENKIDIMIDDRRTICEKLAMNGFTCIYFNKRKFPSVEDKNIIEVKNWDEVYEKIKIYQR